MKRVLTAVFALAALCVPALAGPYEDAALKLFAARQVQGAIAISEVRSGRLVLFASTGGDANTPYLPLSTTKLLIAASLLSHPIKADGAARAMLVHSRDVDARVHALAVRRALGTRAALKELASFGFPPCRAKQRVDCFALSSKTPDHEWAEVLSLGERGILVTLPHLVEFLRAVGNDGVMGGRRVMSPQAARQLQLALRETVTDGTASSAAGILPLPWRMGGKTGSGPGTAGRLDGIFAGLIFDARGRARYAFATYVRKGGLGGGAAAAISAEMAKIVIDGDYK